MTKAASKFARTKKSQPRFEPKMSTAARPSKRPLDDEILTDDEFEHEDSRLDDRSDPAVEEDLDGDLELEFDADLESVGEKLTGDDDQIDDPIRIYLMQMGEIPLLSRPEEIVAAKQIKRARRRFRHIMLATDYVLHAAIDMLKNIRDGRTRLDRTIEVSVINIREKKRLTKVLTPNLATLDHMVEENRKDFAAAIHKRHPAKQRRAAWKRLIARRGRAVRLIEELGLRTQRLQPILEKLKQVSRQMVELQGQLGQLKGRMAPASQAQRSRKSFATS